MPIVPDEEQFDARMPPWVSGQDELEYGLPEAMLLDDRQQIEMLDAVEALSPTASRTDEEDRKPPPDANEPQHPQDVAQDQEGAVFQQQPAMSRSEARRQASQDAQRTRRAETESRREDAKDVAYAKHVESILGKPDVVVQNGGVQPGVTYSGTTGSPLHDDPVVIDLKPSELPETKPSPAPMGKPESPPVRGAAGGASVREDEPFDMIVTYAQPSDESSSKPIVQPSLVTEKPMDRRQQPAAAARPEAKRSGAVGQQIVDAPVPKVEQVVSGQPKTEPVRSVEQPSPPEQPEPKSAPAPMPTPEASPVRGSAGGASVREDEPFDMITTYARPSDESASKPIIQPSPVIEKPMERRQQPAAAARPEAKRSGAVGQQQVDAPAPKIEQVVSGQPKMEPSRSVEKSSPPEQPQRDRRYVPPDWMPPGTPMQEVASIASGTDDRSDIADVDVVSRETGRDDIAEVYRAAEFDFAGQVASTAEMEVHYLHNALSRLRDLEISLMRSSYL